MSVVFLTVFLSACFNSSVSDISKAKDDILWETANETTNENIDLNTNSDLDNSAGIPKVEDEGVSYEENQDKFEQAEKQEVKKEKYSVDYLTDEKFLTVDSLDDEDVLDSEIEITWTTLIPNVDKIIVSFSNETSTFPDDVYQLKWFSSWDSTFLYRAFSKYETLDDWVNKYIIEAHSWNVVSKLELTINVFEDDIEINDEDSYNYTNIQDNSSEIIEELNIKTLPQSEVFWSPVSLWSWKYSYDGIRGLELHSVWTDILDQTTDSVTAYLTETIDGWFFWNTLSTISNWKGVSFYVVRLDWDKYFYEKHYYTNNWVYWILTLESGTWVSLDQLEEKNSSLKDINDEFVITAISDVLFKKIAN